jgi:hypothetical protein
MSRLCFSALHVRNARRRCTGCPGRTTRKPHKHWRFHTQGLTIKSHTGEWFGPPFARLRIRLDADSPRRNYAAVRSFSAPGKSVPEASVRAVLRNGRCVALRASGGAAACPLLRRSVLAAGAARACGLSAGPPPRPFGLPPLRSGHRRPHPASRWAYASRIVPRSLRLRSCRRCASSAAVTGPPPWRGVGAARPPPFPTPPMAGRRQWPAPHTPPGSVILARQ